MYIFINILFIIAVITFIASIVFLWKSAKMIKNGNKKSDGDVKKWDKRGIITLTVSVGIFLISYILSLIV